jgi:dolichol-phosphate mannosyltransferase
VWSVNARRARFLRKEDAIILIPSLHPDEKLGQYVSDLITHGFARIVVVDDGSGPEYAAYFNALKKHPECAVLGYETNHGKGFALKFGMVHILREYPDAPGVITADSDGQHTAPDCLKTAQAMLDHPGKLILGSRDFASDNVPPKSKTGNRLTSFFFMLLYGHWLPDTQTGLRGISKELMPLMMDIPGDRFEYEMNMLIHCAGWHIGFEIVPIDTIYLEGNTGTHFRPFHDSARIYKLLFANFFKFASASALSTLLDIGLFTLLDKVVIPTFFPNFASSKYFGPVLAATAIARVCSALFNYRMNRQFVFRIQRSRGSLLRYGLLVVMVMLASAALVNWLNLYVGMGRTLAKVLVDTGLFFVNYRISKSWVFTSPQERKH